MRLPTPLVSVVRRRRKKEKPIMRQHAPGTSLLSRLLWWGAWCLPLLLWGAVAEDDRTLYVHIIPHSHCDPGWLDTFEQYYRRDVGRILTGVMHALDRFVQHFLTFLNIS